MGAVDLLAHSQADTNFLNGLPIEIEESPSLEVLEHFRNLSTLSSILMKDPGSFEMLEMVYTGHGIEGFIDEYLFGSPSGQALQYRLEAVTSYLANQLIKLVIWNKPTKVLNLGSGPGRDTIGAIARHAWLSELVSVECVDTNSDALIKAKELTEKERISQSFTFTQKSLTQLSYHQEIDLGLMIGILCSLEHRSCVALLRKVKRYFKKGGMLVASNISNNMPKEDPLMTFIMEDIIGWNLVCKAPEQLKQIFEQAGYQWQGCFYDEPMRFHTMGVGIVV